MEELDFHSEFAASYNKGDYDSANVVLLKELGNLLVNKRSDFVFLLTECGVPANESMSDAELINLFIESVGNNKQLALGASLLINMNNKQSGFDGDDVINNKSVRSAYFVLSDRFSNFGDGSMLTAIGGAVKGITGVVGKGLDNRNQKLNGPMIALQKKQDAKAVMQQQAAKLKQTKANADAKKKSDATKTTKIIIISVVSIVVLGGIIATVIYLKKKK